MLALRLAVRDLRGSRGFRLLVVCVALGAAAIAMVGLLSDSILHGVKAGARSSIGGDVSLRLFHLPPSGEQLAAFAEAGVVAQVAETRPLVWRGGRSVLAELKAVDGYYPLYGTLELAGGLPPAAVLSRERGVWGAAVGRSLLDSLGAAVGDNVTVGSQSFEIRAVIENEPDRALRGFSLGPRIIVSIVAAESAGLLQPGSQTYWYSRIKLRADIDPADWIADIRRRFPDAGFRIVNAGDGVPGVERTLALASSLAMFVAMGILLVGAIGISGSVSAYLDRKRGTIAVLRSMGATPALIVWIYLAEVVTAALFGIAAGLTVAVLAVWQITPLLAEFLPVAPGIRLAPLAIAGAFSLLATLLFALWPLGKAERLSPQFLFRTPLAGQRQRPKRARIVAMGGLGFGLIGLLVAAAPLPLAAIAFSVGAAMVCLCLLGLGKLIALAAAWAGRWQFKGMPVLRVALANLHRPGAATASLVMAFGLSLTLLVAVATLRGNAERHLQNTLPASSPDLVLLNVDPAAAGKLDRMLEEQPDVVRWERAPFLHGQVTRIDGVSVADRRIPREVAFVIRGDRGLSWRDSMPGDGLIAGEGWAADYAGPPLLSVDEKVARKLGVGVGDTLTLSILGEAVEGTIANLRQVDWAGLDLDFPILLSPPSRLPAHQEVAAVWVRPGTEAKVRAALARAMPLSPAISMASVIAFLRDVADGAGKALTAVSLATGVAAFLVLGGAMAAGHARRSRDAAILAMVGASRRQLLLIAALEFFLIGLVAAGAALVFGSIAAWAAVADLIAVRPLAGAALMWLAGALGLLLAVGLIAGWRSFGRPPGQVLRQGG